LIAIFATYCSFISDISSLHFHFSSIFLFLFSSLHISFLFAFSDAPRHTRPLMLPPLPLLSPLLYAALPISLRRFHYYY
jgi:hypothetical protein